MKVILLCFFSIFLIAMDSPDKFSCLQNILLTRFKSETQKLPLEIVKNIEQHIQPFEWWYCHTILSCKDFIQSAIFNEQGNYLVTRSNKTITIWNSNGEVLNSIDHTNYITAMKLHPQKDLLCTSVYNGFTYVWDINNLEQKCYIDKKNLSFQQWHPSRDYLLTIDTDNTIQVWNINGTMQKQFLVSSLMFIAWHPIAYSLIMQLKDKKIIIWHGKTKTETTSVDHQGILMGFISGKSEDFALMRVGDTNPLLQVIAFEGIVKSGIRCCGTIKMVDFHPVKSIVGIIFSDRNSVGIWIIDDAGYYDLVHDEVLALTWHPSESYLATTANSAIKIWNYATGQLLQSFDHEYQQSFAWHPLTNCVAIGHGKRVKMDVLFAEYTLDQLRLKHAFLTWLLIEKPNYAAYCSSNGNKMRLSWKKVFLDILTKCKLDLQDSNNIWDSFPKNMQVAIRKTLFNRIKKYRKKVGRRFSRTY